MPTDFILVGIFLFVWYSKSSIGEKMREFLIISAGFFIGFMIRSMFSYLFIAGTYLKYVEDLEKKFLLLSVNFIQWKAHALQILELSYEKASEEDPEQKESFKIFKNRVEEKYDETGEGFVRYMSNILPYKPKYKNWSEAIQYLETLRREGKL